MKNIYDSYLKLNIDGAFIGLERVEENYAHFCTREKANQEPGRELPIQQKFMWGSDAWFVLSAYLSEEGLVLDVCKQIDPESIRAFIEKWLDHHDRLNEFSGEMMEQLQAENPTDEQIRPFLRVNGQDLQWNRSSGIGWNSCLGEGEENSLEAKSTMYHYGLDRNMGWVIERKRRDFYSSNHRRTAYLVGNRNHTGTASRELYA